VADYTLKRVDEATDVRAERGLPGEMHIMTLEEKTDLARRLYEAVNRGDLDAVVEFYDPSAEHDISRSRALHRGIYYGRHDIRRGWAELVEPWTEYRFEPYDFADSGADGLLFSSRARLTGRDGITLEAGSAQLWTLRDGRIVRWVFFQSREEAEAAAP
jgi:ketosteroid isomerase-like protein